MMVDARETLERLYLITDRDSAAEGVGTVVHAVEAALEGGARLVQLRDKEQPVVQTWELGRRIAAFCSAHGARILVNDRADLAVCLGAAGVHRPGGGLPVSEIRKVCGEDALVGVSAHGRDELDAAVGGGADFATLSPVFPTQSKPGYGPPLGLETFGRLARSVEIPVFALGGVTPERVADCLEAGAWGVAVMSGIMAAEDPQQATQAYLEALER